MGLNTVLPQCHYSTVLLLNTGSLLSAAFHLLLRDVFQSCNIVEMLGDYQASASLSGVDFSQNSRRLSTRSIKRKKFDDELVESSLIKSDRARPRQQSASETRILLPCQSASVPSVVTEHIDLPTPPAVIERKKVHKVCIVTLCICFVTGNAFSGNVEI